MNKFNIEIGKTLKYFRKLNNLSQEKLANELNLHRTSIIQIEKGEQRLSLDKLYKILNLLNIDANTFLKLNENNFKEKNIYDCGFIKGYEEGKKYIKNKIFNIFRHKDNK